MRGDKTATHLAREFPGHTEFVVMPRADWDRLALVIAAYDVPKAELIGIFIQHIELTR